jgi:signal transduction histidine kinase
MSDMPDDKQLRSEIMLGAMHTFRTPQTSMIGCSLILHEHPEMLGNVSPTDEQRQFFSRIHEATTFVRDEIEACFLYGKKQVQSLQALPPDYFDLGKVAQSLLPVVRYWLKGSDVRLNVQIAGGLPLVYGYGYHTRQTIKDMIMAFARCIGQGVLTLRVGLNNDAEVLPQVTLSYNMPAPMPDVCLEALHVDPRMYDQGSKFWRSHTARGASYHFSVPSRPVQSPD